VELLEENVSQLLIMNNKPMLLVKQNTNIQDKNECLKLISDKSKKETVFDSFKEIDFETPYLSGLKKDFDEFNVIFLVKKHMLKLSTFDLTNLTKSVILFFNENGRMISMSNNSSKVTRGAFSVLSQAYYALLYKEGCGPSIEEILNEK
jgi:hypothetical protein